MARWAYSLWIGMQPPQPGMVPAAFPEYSASQVGVHACQRRAVCPQGNHTGLAICRGVNQAGVEQDCWRVLNRCIQHVEAASEREEAVNAAVQRCMDNLIQQVALGPCVPPVSLSEWPLGPPCMSLIFRAGKVSQDIDCCVGGKTGRQRC